MPAAEPIYIGIDLTDPYAKHKRACARAILGADLHCIFDEWEYSQTGSAMVPSQLERSTYIVAIDGPQGLAKLPEAKMRICERQLHVAGKSPFIFRPLGQPYAGFILGSVELFYSLYRSAAFQIYGIYTKLEANIIEVYPGAIWPVLAGQLLKNKKLLEGRKARYDLLIKLGLSFHQQYSAEKPPNHDQLDAAVAAYIAYLFKCGKTRDYGEKSFEDSSLKILREGIIVQPIKSSY